MSRSGDVRGFAAKFGRGPRLLVAGALVAAAAPLYIAGSAQAAVGVPANFFTVVDTGGPNDVVGQSDLTQEGRDNTDPTYLKLFWSWDDASFSGANTGNACALLDTNVNGKIDVAVCVSVHTVGGVTVEDGGPTASTCDDSWTDRCGHPAALAFAATDIEAGALGTSSPPAASPPADLSTATDPFTSPPANDSDYPNDTSIEVDIKKAFLAGASLVNVCSFPSSGKGGNNNDPKDCIVNPGGGALVINKHAGSDTTTHFPFTVNPGAVGVTIIGTGSSAPTPMPPGSASFSETVPAGWLLTAASCTLSDGVTATGTADLLTHSVSGITIEAGKTTTCDVTDASDASLSLTKTASPTIYSAAGQVITYTLTAKNTGTADLSAASITDTDPGVSITSCTPAQPVATLAPNATIVCTATYTITAADVTSGTFTNTGHVSGTAPDGTTPTATKAATVGLFAPSLSLSKTALPTTYSAAGQVITYTLSAKNTGNVDLSAVSITDTDPGVTIGTCTPAQPVATLAPNATLVCSASYTTTAADVTHGSFLNTGHVDGTDPNHAAVSKTATATITFAPVVIAPVPPVLTPNLGVTKTSVPVTGSFVKPGDKIVYTLSYGNTGTGPATGVVLSDVLPADLDFVTGTATPPGAYDAPTRTLSWSLGTLAAGATGTQSFTAQVASTAVNGQVLHNVGVLNAPGIVDPSNADDVVVSVPATGNLTATKAVDKSVANIGDTLTYTVLVAATGTLDETNVVVNDQVPTGTSYVAGSAACVAPCTATEAGGLVTWTVGTLTHGTSATLTFKVTVDQPAAAADGSIAAETIDNSAIAGSTQDPTVASNVVTTQTVAVLGVKVTRKPPVAVKGTKTVRLPFTGLAFPLWQVLGLGFAMLLVGSALAAGLRPRRIGTGEGEHRWRDS